MDDRHHLKEPETAIDQFFLEDKTIEAEKRQVRKALGMTPSKAKTKKKSMYDRLRVELYKAGVDKTPSSFIKSILITTLVILFFGTFAGGVWALRLGYGYLGLTVFLLIWWILGFLILYPVVAALFQVSLHYRAFKRKLQVENALPEFLRLVATNYRSGLPLDKALIKSNKPRFGIFSKEIELMAKSTMIKGDLSTSLIIFGKKFDSKILERSMNSISAAVRSGSNISDLLEEIASNITKMRNMRSSMAANVKNYIIFIIIAAIIIAPLMFSMSYVMNTTISDVKASMETGTDGSGGSLAALSQTGGMEAGDFDVFALLMLLTNSIICTLVISMIKNGNFQQGIKNIPIYIILSYVLYFSGKYIILNMLNFL